MASPAPRFWSGILVILMLALLWRIAIAVAMPVMSRDGVTFCWYARTLETVGLDHLRAESTHQHPLFPGLILMLKLLATACGAADTPWLWQRCGQIVSLSSGLCVVFLTGLLTSRLADRLGWYDPPRVGLAAALLAAILPLNVGLSADVMSDQLHLAFYLGALYAGLSVRGLAAGLLGGLAFLTRPEGAVLVLACVLAVMVEWGARLRQRLAHALCVVIGFSVLAAPYWLVTGTFSAKKNPLELLSGGTDAELGLAAVRDMSPARRATERREVARARLKLHDVAPLELPLWLTERLLHAGRYVIPLAAAVVLVSQRRRLMQAALVGPVTAFGLHGLLLIMLLHRYDYLDARHALPLVALLIPFAALGLLSVPQRWCGVAWLVMLAPLVIYALRVPNGDQGYLRVAAAWLTQHDPEVRTKLLTGGNSQSRIAYYAGMRWRYWLEDPTRWELIRREFLTQRPDYLAIETGEEDHYERRGHAALLAAMQADAELGPRLRERLRMDLDALDYASPPLPSTTATLWLFELDWR